MYSGGARGTRSADIRRRFKGMLESGGFVNNWHGACLLSLLSLSKSLDMSEYSRYYEHVFEKIISVR